MSLLRDTKFEVKIKSLRSSKLLTTKTEWIPGNFLGFRNGTNFAPMANAIEGPNMNPRASIPRMKFGLVLPNHAQADIN